MNIDNRQNIVPRLSGNRDSYSGPGVVVLSLTTAKKSHHIDKKRREFITTGRKFDEHVEKQIWQQSM
jgi:hypothetical protein